MAKPHAGAANTPRPRSSSGANRSSVCSSSSAAPARDLASLAKEAGKLLTYDDDDAAASHASSATQLLDPALPEAALDLPDPDEAATASSTVVSDPPHDAIPAPAVAQVAPPALKEMELVLAELRGASGLSAGSKRLLAALAEAAADELDALRTRRAAFWRKLRVGVLAATVFSVAAIDLVLAAALLGATRGSGRHALPPT